MNPLVVCSMPLGSVDRLHPCHDSRPEVHMVQLLAHETSSRAHPYREGIWCAASRHPMRLDAGRSAILGDGRIAELR